jgi:hypothetical protein
VGTKKRMSALFNSRLKLRGAQCIQNVAFNHGLKIKFIWHWFTFGYSYGMNSYSNGCTEVGETTAFPAKCKSKSLSKEKISASRV